MVFDPGKSVVGVKASPHRFIIYGREDIGKSSFPVFHTGSVETPKAYYLNLENRLDHVDAIKSPLIATYDDLIGALRWLRDKAPLFQAAFYRSVLHEVEPSIPKLPFCFIVVEKVEPYRVGVWQVDERILFIKEQENKKFLEQFKVCREEDHWPTLFEEMRSIDVI